MISSSYLEPAPFSPLMPHPRTLFQQFSPAFSKTSSCLLLGHSHYPQTRLLSPFSKEKKEKRHFNPLDYTSPSATSPVFIFLPLQGFQFFSSNCTKVSTLGPVWSLSWWKTILSANRKLKPVKEHCSHWETREMILKTVERQCQKCTLQSILVPLNPGYTFKNIDFPRYQPTPTESESLGLRPRHMNFLKLHQWCRCIGRVGSHHKPFYMAEMLAVH